MQKFTVWLMAIAFAAIGGGIFAYKAFVLQFPLEPDLTSESWHIEARLAFNAHNKPIKAQMYLPRFTRDFSIVDENFVSKGFGFNTTTSEATGNRIARWSKRNASGRELIFYRGVIYRSDSSAHSVDVKPEREALIYGSAAFTEQTQTSPAFLAMSAVIEEVRARSADNETFAQELLRLLASRPVDSRVQSIQQEFTELKTDQDIAIRILRHADIPARVMHGVLLKDGQSNTPLIAWIEMYENKRWERIETEGSESSDIYMPWWSGENPAYKLEGGLRPSLTVSVKRHLESVLTEAIWSGDDVSKFFYDWSVYSLPIDIQLVFSMLLMIPIGALVIAFLRQVIGIKTFGTFMPVLVAVAFRETQLVWGIALFILILTLGMFFRGILNQIRLLMVPRLSAVLTIVVFIIFLLSIVTFKLGITAGLSMSLFPIVILAMIIERMSIVWEEYGAGEALKMGLGSLIVAILAYLFMSNDQLGHLIVTFPELLLVVVSLNIMLGRYNGYKLFEYLRFRSMKNQVE